MTKSQAKQNKLVLAKARIEKLVEKYEKLEKEGKIKNYNEAQTRNEFIEPLFEALGWDMRNQDHEDEVTTEENISGDRVDLAFRLNNIPVMFLEAKAMKVDLDEWKWAEQAINYSWNKGVDWAVLTDFEGIKVFNATLPPEGPGENRFLTLSYRDYLKDFEKLWWLSKESMEKGVLEEEARKTGLLKEKRSVDEVLFEDLMDWRQKLSNNFAAYNQKVDQDLLDEGVQRLLDRLIFVRTAEDRKIEEKVLIVKLREWEKKGRKGDLMKVLNQVFEDFRETYDSKLFEEHPFEKWEIESTILGKVIKGLYESKEGYTYDFSAISADVLGGIYEQYLGHILEKAKKSAKVTEKHKKRKSQGIYYTPKFIVDYIVENTLGKKLKEIKKDSKNCLRDVKKLKILDPACGSGSFLIRAFEVLDEFYEKECGVTGNPMARRMEILTTNIYGVDLDPQAVEIARLNLLLRALKSKGSLPSLEGNIKCGNSLVSEGDPELRPFKWEEEFPDVLKKGGFDVVIGNPPYVKSQSLHQFNPLLANEIVKNYYSAQSGSYDIYLVFIERGAKLLNKEGHLGFIVPHKFFNSGYGKNLREFLLSRDLVNRVVHFGDAQVFGDASTYTALVFLQNSRNKIIKAAKIDENEIKKNILDKLSFLKISSELWKGKEWNIIDEKSLELIKRIKRENQDLEAITSNIFQGPKSGADNVFILEKISEKKEIMICKSKFLDKEFPLEKPILYKYIKGKNLRRYKIDYSNNEYIIFPYDSKGKLFSRDILKKKYPLTFKYFALDKNKEILCAREKGRFSKQFWGYSRPQNMQIVFNEKILTPFNAFENSFSLDDKGDFVFSAGISGAYGIILKDATGISYEYLLGLLNSKLVEFFIRKTSTSLRGGFYSYENKYIKNIPIKVADKKRQVVITNLVSKILDLNKKLLEVEENSEEWKNLNKKIEKVDGEIDSAVCKLYKLNRDEIKIIEQQTEI